MLMLDNMRAEFAWFLANDPNGRFRMDAALAHVIRVAYERGLDDGRRAEHPTEFHDPALQLVRDILDPEMYGHAVTAEVRNAAKRALQKVGAGDTAVQGDMLLPANADLRGRPLADGPA